MTSGAFESIDSAQPSGRTFAGSVRAWTASTPARLWLLAAVSISGLVVFGVVATIAAHSRHTAADAVAVRTEPLLVHADRLNSALSDADATAVTTFLTGGLEPRARRARYLADLRSASNEVAALSRAVADAPDARAPLDLVARELPVYSGLIETARANNRQGLPVGAAYLRQASTLMRETILPAAARLYEVEGRQLSASYASGVSTSTFVAILLVGLVALCVLVLSQLYLLHVANRIFNVPLVLASLLLVGGLAWGAVSFILEQRALVSAQRDGSDAVEVLAATRVLLLRSERDESLALVARGGGSQYLTDFDAVALALGPADGSSGLLADVSRLAHRTGSAAAFGDFASTLARFRATHRQIAALEADGHFRRAVQISLQDGHGEAPALARLNADIGDQIATAQARFDLKASRATAALTGLGVGLALLVISAAVLAAIGFGQRIGEYR